MRTENGKTLFGLVCIGVGALIVWEVVTRLKLVPALFLPSPGAVGITLIDLFLHQGFGWQVLVSLQRIGLGTLAALVVGLPIGIGLGVSRVLERLLDPIFVFIRYTPVAAVIPLLILWFGIGEGQKVLVIFLAIFFQIVSFTANAVTRMPRPLLEHARLLGVRPFSLIVRVIWPWILPQLLEDLRIALWLVWSGLVMAEIIGAVSGIGYVIIQSQRLLQTPRIMAAVFFIGCAGVGMDLGLRWIRRHLCPWISRTSLYA